MKLLSIIECLAYFLLIFTSTNGIAAKELSVYLDEDISNIYKINKNQTSELLKLTRPPIIGFSRDKGWICNICKEIPSNKNGNLKVRRYKKMRSQWEIKDDQFWSDGTAITNKDIAYTISQLQYKYFIFKADKNNLKKFEIKFRTNTYDFYQMFNFSLLPHHKLSNMKIEEKLDNKEFLKDGFAYGPYKIESATDNSVKLIRNKYFSKKAKVAKISFYQMNDDSKSIQNPSYISKNFSSIQELLLSDPPNLNLRPQTSYNLEFLAFNLNNPILTEKNIRQAIYLAIDREELSKALYKGFAKPALDISLNSRLGVTKNYEERIELAKKLISKSNFYRYSKESKRIVLNLDFENSTLRMQEASRIKKMLKQINIDVKIKPRTKKFFASMIKELNYSGLLLSSFNNLPDTNYYNLLSSNRIPKAKNDYTGKNIFSWFNKKANSLLRKYQSNFDSRQRNEIFNEINELVYTNVPFSPLYYHPKLVILPKNVLNFPFNIDHRVEYQISQDWIIRNKKTSF